MSAALIVWDLGLFGISLVELASTAGTARFGKRGYSKEAIITSLSSIIRYQPQTTIVQNIARLLLGAFILFAGIGHLTFARTQFLAQVPNWVPLEGDLVVVLSGIVEIILGAALILLHRYRAALGWAAAVFFVLIFPGNIAQYVNRVDAFGLDSDMARFVRLLFQPLLILWALWSSGAWQAWRQRHEPAAGSAPPGEE